MKSKFSILIGSSLLLLASGCTTTKDVQYIQDFAPNSIESTMANSGLLIDKHHYHSNKIDLGYRVDEAGDIVFPQLGTLHVAGLNRRQLEGMIKQRIIKEGLLKDFSVSVSFQTPRFPFWEM